MVRGLWDSWDDDAFVKDKGSGIYADPAKCTCSTTRASISRSRARSTSRASPQGHPILIQAGSSGPGQDLAARTADVVFTAQQSIEEAQAFYKSLKERVARLAAVRRTTLRSCRASCR